MDCDVCQLRGCVGHCTVCKKLLCEVCGVTCSDCGKMLCMEHTQRSRSGRPLCEGCMQAYQAARAARERADEPAGIARADGHSFAALSADSSAEVGVEAKDEPDEERPILTGSGYAPKPPWLRSVYAASTGVVILLVALWFPIVRAIAQPWISCAAAALSGSALVWAVKGLTDERYYRNRALNLIGLVVAVVTLLVAVAVAGG